MIAARRQLRGFTLLELTLSMAIGSIILLAAASLLGSFGDGYERVGGGMAVEREARAAIGQLRSDLSTAKFHRDEVMEISATAWPADRIGFLCLQPAEAQSNAGYIGDLCAVNYYLKDLTLHGRTVRCLMRGFRDSADVFKALGDDSVAALFAPRGGIDEPVAFGVVAFEARPKSRDASGSWVDWSGDGETGPEVLDVRLVLVRRELATRLRRPVDWNDRRLLGSSSKAGRNKNLEVYKAMIRYGNHE